MTSTMTNSATTTRAMMPNTFTQRGVPVIDSRSRHAAVSSRLSG
jgi:hypothetical protein